MMIDLYGFSMPLLTQIIKSLQANHTLHSSDLEDEYPDGGWWEDFWHLSEMHNKFTNHTIYEVNYKIIKTIEAIIKPLNYIFHSEEAISPVYLAGGHPLTAAVVNYSDCVG
ncbi:hypothetical protein IWW39_004401 [Coemansia spiralis]|uniref:Uncharacterized protein n=1 Tax=Coemansia spiralis TaxID=417178 RepID=A0A9W8L3D8_9FUNG|nr:hypothetical protein IWW39_004401 [Coemansia spiralis]